MTRPTLIATGLVALLLITGGVLSQIFFPSSTVTKPTVVPIGRVTPALACPPGDVTMQCVLATQPPPPVSLLLARPAPSIYGIDGFGPPPIATLRAIHAHFGAAYFSHPVNNPKNWTPSASRAYAAAGFGRVGVWETTALRSSEGRLAGVEDAVAARSQAAAVGNTADAITFAIDFDASGGQVASYFSGAQSILHGRVNAYGGYYPLRYLSEHGLVGHLNWQTYAWSGGHWLPASIAPLEQYLNGNAFDNDRALLPNYGQWGFKPVPARVHCFGPHAHAKLASCKRTRRLVSARSRKRNSTIKAIVGRQCASARPPGSRTFSALNRWYPHVRKHPAVCRVLRQRVIWFEGRIHADLF